MFVISLSLLFSPSSYIYFIVKLFLIFSTLLNMHYSMYIAEW